MLYSSYESFVSETNLDLSKVNYVAFDLELYKDKLYTQAYSLYNIYTKSNHQFDVHSYVYLRFSEKTIKDIIRLCHPIEVEDHMLFNLDRFIIIPYKEFLNIANII